MDVLFHFVVAGCAKDASEERGPCIIGGIISNRRGGGGGLGCRCIAFGEGRGRFEERRIGGGVAHGAGCMYRSGSSAMLLDEQ